MNKLFEIAPFRTRHPVPSQGYVVYGTKQKLKPAYAGLSGPEIKRLRDDGEQVTDKVEVPEVAFTGDTTGDWIDDPANADALRAKLLIMECTFIDDAVSKQDAERFGHTHIDDIVARADKFQNEAILLIHFSARYKAEEVRACAQGEIAARFVRKMHAHARRVRLSCAVHRSVRTEDCCYQKYLHGGSAFVVRLMNVLLRSYCNRKVYFDAAFFAFFAVVFDVGSLVFPS